MLQEYCKLSNLPLFKSKARAYRRKNRKTVRKNVQNDERAISSDRHQLERHLSGKRNQRLSRHLRRSSPLKRNIINTSLIKKQLRSGRRPLLKSKNPRHRVKVAKKLVQIKVLTCKELMAKKRAGKGNSKHKRSKSATAEFKLFTESDVKLKITSTIQDCIDKMGSRRPSNIVRFREIEKQFGEVIERIKNLKFYGPE